MVSKVVVYVTSEFCYRHKQIGVGVVVVTVLVLVLVLCQDSPGHFGRAMSGTAAPTPVLRWLPARVTNVS